ncbi:VanZ-like [Candidatus Nanopelagicaceae bacterium]
MKSSCEYNQSMPGFRYPAVLARIYILTVMIFLLFPRKPLSLRVETFQNFNYRGQIPFDSHSSIIHRLLNLSGPWERAGNVIIFFLLYISVKIQLRRIGFGLTLFITCSISAIVEFIQFFIPGRVSSLLDFSLNSIGALSAFCVGRFMPRIFQQSGR